MVPTMLIRWRYQMTSRLHAMLLGVKPRDNGEQPIYFIWPNLRPRVPKTVDYSVFFDHTRSTLDSPPTIPVVHVTLSSFFGDADSVAVGGFISLLSNIPNTVATSQSVAAPDDGRGLLTEDRVMEVKAESASMTDMAIRLARVVLSEETLVIATVLVLYMVDHPNPKKARNKRGRICSTPPY
uniref:Uncharacterized protein n=1 Tax=Branchiostoma floridae TaxID=7739 RepID=C3YSX2_BRAFL|eukprot:XP_002600624.1 hypothetical protein BRAFLDRAFT_95138 [Branchiostoma floridae]